MFVLLYDSHLLLCASPVWLQISMKCHVANSSQAAALVTAIILGDAPLLGSPLVRPINTHRPNGTASMFCTVSMFYTVSDNGLTGTSDLRSPSIACAVQCPRAVPPCSALAKHCTGALTVHRVCLHGGARTLLQVRPICTSHMNSTVSMFCAVLCVSFVQYCIMFCAVLCVSFVQYCIYVLLWCTISLGLGPVLHCTVMFFRVLCHKFLGQLSLSMFFRVLCHKFLGQLSLSMFFRVLFTIF